MIVSLPRKEPKNFYWCTWYLHVGWWSGVLVSFNRRQLQRVNINGWDVHFSTSWCSELPAGCSRWYTIPDSLQGTCDKGSVEGCWNCFSSRSKWGGEIFAFGYLPYYTVDGVCSSASCTTRLAYVIDVYFCYFWYSKIKHNICSEN